MSQNKTRAWYARKNVVALLAFGTLAACREPTTASTAPEVVTPPVFGFGNGAPSGPHYNLNWIGVPKNKTADMTGNNGGRIFFPLWGNAKVLLCESGLTPPATLGTLICPSDPVFQVLDANATDGQGAFALPNPDPGNTGTTVYSVYVRALGTPGGHATNTTCGVDTNVSPPDTICSVIQVVLDRKAGQSQFKNVSKCMLYVYADVNGDGILDRVPLFDSTLQSYFWDYDNQGLKLAAFRFYPLPTNVPAATSPGQNC
jgi:hypothetical protein